MAAPAAQSGTETGSFDASIGDILFVYKRDASADWSIRDFSNARYCVMGFSVFGKATYTCNHRKYDIQPGAMLYFPAGTVRSARSDPEEPWSFYTAGFELNPATPQAAVALNSLPTVSYPHDGAECETLFDRLDHSWAAQEPGSELLCRSLVLQLLHVIVQVQVQSRFPVAHRHRIQRVLHQLHRNYTHAYRVDELAEITGLSESRFRVLFKELTGLSVIQYINKIRINRATSLLLSGEYNVTKVAELVGFQDVYYFSRMFKQVTGTNPSSLLQ